MEDDEAHEQYGAMKVFLLSYDDEKTFLTVLPWFHTANEKGMHENHLYLSSYYGIK